jgi:Cytochrome c oxidase subunit III
MPFVFKFIKANPSLVDPNPWPFLKYLKTNHSYHLVDPSPWPFVGSLGGFCLTVGGVLYMHRFNNGWELFLTGLFIIVFIKFVWWQDIARVKKTQKNKTGLELGLREGLTALLESIPGSKQLFKERKSSTLCIVPYLTTPMLLKRSIPISLTCLVKEMKTRILGSCLTVQELWFSNIFTLNVSYICQETNQTKVKLIAKSSDNRLKNIVDPQQVVINFLMNNFRRNYVMPEASKKGLWTRSPVIFHNTFKAYYGTKGARFFSGNRSNVDSNGSSLMVTTELSHLREYSVQNNITEVNKCVNSLLSNPKFWILCYESIKSNPGVNSPENIFLTEKALTMNGILRRLTTVMFTNDICFIYFLALFTII